MFSLCSDALKNKIRNQNKKINENIFKDRQDNGNLHEFYFEDDYSCSISSSEYEKEFDLLIKPNFQFGFYNISELNN